MRKAIIAAIAAFPVSALAYDVDMSEITSVCAAKFPDALTSQEACVAQQVDALVQIEQNIGEVPGEAAKQFIADCTTDWPNDYHMQAGCISGYVAGWKTLNQ